MMQCKPEMRAPSVAHLNTHSPSLPETSWHVCKFRASQSFLDFPPLPPHFEICDPLSKRVAENTTARALCTTLVSAANLELPIAKLQDCAAPVKQFATADDASILRGGRTMLSMATEAARPLGDSETGVSSAITEEEGGGSKTHGNGNWSCYDGGGCVPPMAALPLPAPPPPPPPPPPPAPP